MIAFSVIIPLYNKEATIRSTLDSVLRQSCPDFEVIVVDDGSADGSVAIVQSIRDERIRLIGKENGGPGSARNLGIRHARFDWVIWLDADDLMLPGVIEHFAETVDRYPQADMVVGNFELEEAGTVRPYHKKNLTGQVGNAFKEWFKKDLMPCAGTYCCRKDILTRHPYREELRRSEDTEILFHIFREARIVRTDFITMRYRRDFSLESRSKTALRQDFQGHLDFSGNKSLWERICLYELYVEAKNNYPDEVHTVYPDMNRRFLLKLAYFFAFWCRALWRKLKID